MSKDIKPLWPMTGSGLYHYNVSNASSCVLATIKIGGKAKKYPLLKTDFKKYDRYQVDCAIDGTAYISGAQGSLTVGSVTVMDGLIIGCNKNERSDTASTAGALKDLISAGSSLTDRHIGIELKTGTKDNTTTVAVFSGVITGIDVNTSTVEGQSAHIITLNVLGGLSTK